MSARRRNFDNHAPIRLVVLALLTGALGACATVPTPLQGQFAPVTPRDAAANGDQSAAVRWGGEIINVEPRADETCFEVLSRDLWDDARPKRRDHSDGRFIACSKGFYDPAAYPRGRELTVTGSLSGSERHKVGEYDYTYARVVADQVYLWPKRETPTGYPYSAFGPWPYDPFWGPYWGGWWSPPIIVVHGGHGHH